MTLKVDYEEWDKITTDDKVKWIAKEDGTVKRVDSDKRKKVVVVGAGMAGLVAAYELDRIGHDVVILEAQHRVGGRVWTLREPFADGLYAEAGAMRLPKPHKLTRAYIEKAGLTSSLKTFHNECDNAHYFFFDVQRRYCQYKNDPGSINFGILKRREVKGRLRREGKRDRYGLQMPPEEKQVPLGRHYTASELWNDVLEGIKQDSRFFNKRSGPVWSNLADAFDHVSTFTFLKEGGAIAPLRSHRPEKHKQKQLFDPWTDEEIYYYGLVEGQQARMNNSVLALLREHFESFSDGVKEYEYLAGGMDQLPRFLAGRLQHKIRYGSWVEEIELTDDTNVLQVHYRTAAQDRGVEPCDHLILAVPFTILRHMKGTLLFSRQKQHAIQALNYSAAGKIFLQCRNRFWEEGESPICGGHSQTDIALRSVWYPQHGEETGRGVLLASYTWGRDAERWGHLSEHDRIRRAIQQLDRLHPEAKIIENNVVEVGTSVMWQNQVFTGGAFALFNPQQERLYRDVIRHFEAVLKSGKTPRYVHFAGEHTCLQYHRWIEGAVESGLRVAWEVNYTHEW